MCDCTYVCVCVCVHVYISSINSGKWNVQDWTGKVLLRSIRERRLLAPPLCTLSPSLAYFLSFFHQQQHFEIETHFLASNRFSLSSFSLWFSHLSPAVFFPPRFRAVLFSYLLAIQPSFPLQFQAIWSFLLLLQLSLSLSLSPPCSLLLLLWSLSTGGKCPADALAVAQGVADFITMAALYHFRSVCIIAKTSVLLPGPGPIGLCVNINTPVESYMGFHHLLSSGTSYCKGYLKLHWKHLNFDLTYIWLCRITFNSMYEGTQTQL